MDSRVFRAVKGQPPESPAPPAPSDSPVVFVVDDDVSVRESLEPLLAWAGWRVETFATAGEFLERVPVEAVSCLVLDVQLPGLNGLDLQQRLTADAPEMPIVFITGHGDIPMTVRAMKAGAAEFLTSLSPTTCCCRPWAGRSTPAGRRSRVPGRSGRIGTATLR
jgi:CheY-like chemotaxis protein